MEKHFTKTVRTRYGYQNDEVEYKNNVPFTRFKSKRFGITITWVGHIENITAWQIRERLRHHEKSHRQMFACWTNAELEADFNDIN